MFSEILFFVIAVQVIHVQSKSSGQVNAKIKLDRKSEEIDNYRDELYGKLKAWAISENLITENEELGVLSPDHPMYTLFVETQKALDDLREQFFAESLKRAQTLRIDVRECIEPNFSEMLIAYPNTYYDACKNAPLERHKRFAPMLENLAEVRTEVQKCIDRNDMRCVELNFNKLDELAEEYYSSEYLEYHKNGYRFMYKPNRDCKRIVLKTDNFLRSGMIRHGKEANECIKNKIRASGH